MPGEERAQRAEEEGESDRDEREDLHHARTRGLEEELREYEVRGERVDEEVVPLDGGADDGGRDNFAALLWRARHGGCGLCHYLTPLSNY